MLFRSIKLIVLVSNFLSIIRSQICLSHSRLALFPGISSFVSNHRRLALFPGISSFVSNHRLISTLSPRHFILKFIRLAHHGIVPFAWLKFFFFVRSLIHGLIFLSWLRAGPLSIISVLIFMLFSGLSRPILRRTIEICQWVMKRLSIFFCDWYFFIIFFHLSLLLLFVDQILNLFFYYCLFLSFSIIIGKNLLIFAFYSWIQINLLLIMLIFWWLCKGVIWISSCRWPFSFFSPKIIPFFWNKILFLIWQLFFL